MRVATDDARSLRHDRQPRARRPRTCKRPAWCSRNCERFTEAAHSSRAGNCTRARHSRGWLRGFPVPALFSPSGASSRRHQQRGSLQGGGGCALPNRCQRSKSTQKAGPRRRGSVRRLAPRRPVGSARLARRVVPLRCSSAEATGPLSAAQDMGQ